MYIKQHVSKKNSKSKYVVPLQLLGSADKLNPKIAIQQTVIRNTDVVISPSLSKNSCIKISEQFS